MKWGRAVVLAALAWVLIFVEISVTMIGLKFPPVSSWIIHYILLIPIMVIAAGFYYKTGDKTNGILVGIVFLFFGIILDAIITVPLFIIPQGGNYGAYFSNWFMILGFLESVLLVGVYDIIRTRGNIGPVDSPPEEKREERKDKGKKPGKKRRN